MLKITVGLVLLWIGWRLIRHSQDKSHLNRQIEQRTRYTHQANLAAMEERLAVLRVEKAHIDLAVETMRAESRRPKQISLTPPTLDQQVVMDAVSEMNRAKAAVVAVLRSTGASQDRIDEVLKAIESPQDESSGYRD